jgi:hypothetical protein
MEAYLAERFYFDHCVELLRRKGRDCPEFGGNVLGG